MKHCADTSFIVKLLTREKGADGAIDLYRRLNRPKLPFTQIHRMEVASAIAQKAFVARRAGHLRNEILREKKVALGRLDKWLRLALLVEADIEWDTCFEAALDALPNYSERLGCRTIDLIHISIAKGIHSSMFITCDERQAKAARAEGLKAVFVAPD